MTCLYVTPKKNDFNKMPELQICLAEALYEVDSIVADPEVYTKEQLATVSCYEWPLFRLQRD